MVPATGPRWGPATSLERVRAAVEAADLRPTKSGRDFHVLCPRHSERTPSLHVTYRPADGRVNLWCFSRQVDEQAPGAGLVTATSDEDWFGAFQTSVSPTSPRISTVLEIDSFAPDGIGNVVYTGLVKDEENAVVGLYVTSARHAAFEVRVDGNIRLSNQVTDLDLQDGIQLGFSPDGPSASLWVDPARVRGGSCSPTPCCAACRTSPIPRSWRSGGTPSVCARSAARRSPRRRSRVVAGPEPATPFVTTSGHERVSVRI